MIRKLFQPAAHSPPRCKFYGFHARNLACNNRKPKEGANLVKAMLSSGSWVHVQTSPTRIPLHTQQMAVAANENVRPLLLQHRPNPAGIAVWPSADVPHKHAQPTAIPPQFLLEFRTNAVVVNVPVHSTKGRNFCKLVGHLQVTNVASVPNFIHLLQVMKNAFVAMAVGVRKESDSHFVRFNPQDAVFLDQLASMIHRISVLLVGLLFGLTCFAQTGPSSDDKKALKAYASGLEAYLHGHFEEALEALDKAVERDPLFFDAWMLQGQILDQSGQRNAAIDAMLTGYGLRPTGFPKGRLRLCEMLHRSGRYAEGVQVLEVVRSLDQWSDWSTQPDWAAAVAHLEFAIQAKDHPVELQSQPLQGDVNTSAPEYYPAITADGSTLLFTRQIGGRTIYEGQEDFFTAVRTGPHSWGGVQPLRGINTPQNEGAPTLQGDGSRLIFTACSTIEAGYGDRAGKGSCDLFEAEWDDQEGRFSLGVNLGAPNTSDWESQPTLSADGSTLLFVRARRATRDHPAQQDIFMSKRMQSGAWSPASPLSSTINTPGIEENPVLHPDGTTLYFVSNGHPGMGGLDLFKSEREADGSWGVPVNLGYPINTHNDESSVLVTPDGRWALFATDRDEPGNLDLWEMKLPESAIAHEVRVLRGVVHDAHDGEPVEATVDVVYPNGQLVAQVATESRSGHFELPLPDAPALRFRVDHPHYAFYSELVDWSEVNPGSEVVIELTRFEVGTVLTLKDVRFAINSAELEVVFQPELEQLANLLLANDEHIEIVGHTDNRGQEEDNQVLSESRALAVRNYLHDRGVPLERMKHSGQGADSPIATNETEAGRALNRRTEIIVIE